MQVNLLDEYTPAELAEITYNDILKLRQKRKNDYASYKYEVISKNKPRNIYKNRK